MVVNPQYRNPKGRASLIFYLTAVWYEVGTILKLLENNSA